MQPKGIDEGAHLTPGLRVQMSLFFASFRLKTCQFSHQELKLGMHSVQVHLSFICFQIKWYLQNFVEIPLP